MARPVNPTNASSYVHFSNHKQKNAFLTNNLVEVSSHGFFHVDEVGHYGHIQTSMEIQFVRLSPSSTQKQKIISHSCFFFSFFSDKKWLHQILKKKILGKKVASFFRPSPQESCSTNVGLKK